MAIALTALSSAQCARPDLSGEGKPANFAVLDAGRAYRSAQPTGPQLERTIDALGIRTVLNLRGPNAGKDWYDDEAAVCAAEGVELIDFPMSAQSRPNPDLLAGVIDTLQTAEYPMLIHCSGGADRTGLISVIYRMLILGQPREEALAELSPEYLHIRQMTPCMDAVAERYEPTSEWLDWYRANYETIECK